MAQRQARRCAFSAGLLIKRAAIKCGISPRTMGRKISPLSLGASSFGLLPQVSQRKAAGVAGALPAVCNITIRRSLWAQVHDLIVRQSLAAANDVCRLFQAVF